MIEEGESIDHEALEVRQSFETVSKPLRVRATVDLSVGWRKMKSVRESTNVGPCERQSTLESRQSD